MDKGDFIVGLMFANVFIMSILALLGVSSTIGLILVVIQFILLIILMTD